MKRNYRFSITDGKGFHLVFDNGLCLSVQFGNGNYCENYGREDMSFDRLPFVLVQSSTCEIAVIDKNGNYITDKFIDCKGDDVCGYVKFSQFLEVLDKIRSHNANC